MPVYRGRRLTELRRGPTWEILREQKVAKIFEDRVKPIDSLIRCDDVVEAIECYTGKKVNEQATKFSDDYIKYRLTKQKAKCKCRTVKRR